jgi:ATP-dependent DNA helicase PIF1
MSTAPAPARRGKRWSEEEEAYLMANVATLTRAVMAAHLERTASAVKARMVKMAVAAHAAGMPIEEATATYRVSESDMQEFMAKETEKSPARPLAPPTVAAPTPSAPSKPPPIQLTPSQQRAFDIVTQRKSVCITGPAGTGKSTLLQQLRRWADDNDLAMGVTAMTGCAALLIGGRTLHSYLAIGLGAAPVNELVSAARYKYKAAVTRLVGLDILVIDEISMAEAELLDKVSAYLQQLRRNTDPFGGLQLIVIGDFCQLPPVTKNGCPSFAFSSKEWARAGLTVASLTEIVRQQHDTAFADMLQRLRVGEVTPDDLLALRATKDRVFPEGIKPTILYALNRDVNRINEEALAALKAGGAEPLMLKAVYGIPKDKLVAWAKSCDIPDLVEMAVGAQVVVTSNVDIDAGVVNGTRAVISGYRGSPTSPDAVFLKLTNGAVYSLQRMKAIYDVDGATGGYGMSDAANASYVGYYPLKMAWAISTHKAQGMTLDAVEVNLGRSIFEKGQAYTALSRARSLADVRVTDVHIGSFKTHQAVLDFYKRIVDASL